jgi:hypothetical protein
MRICSRARPRRCSCSMLADGSSARTIRPDSCVPAGRVRSRCDRGLGVASGVVGPHALLEHASDQHRFATGRYSASPSIRRFDPPRVLIVIRTKGHARAGSKQNPWSRRIVDRLWTRRRVFNRKVTRLSLFRFTGSALNTRGRGNDHRHPNRPAGPVRRLARRCEVPRVLGGGQLLPGPRGVVAGSQGRVRDVPRATVLPRVRDAVGPPQRSVGRLE